MSQYCTQCGTQNVDEAKYCKSCGHPMENQETIHYSNSSPSHSNTFEEEARQESEEYGKFGGWLLIFAIFVVVGNLFAFRDVGVYFQNEFLDTLKLLYQNGMSEKATLFNIAAYISFVSYGLLLAFTFLFFRKHRDIKDFSLYYFGYNIIATPIIVFLLIKIDLPSINIMSIIVVAVFKVLFYLIMLRYFMVSERVKKTFIRGNDENDNSFVIALLLGIAAISLASILYAKASDKHTLTYDQNATSKAQVSTEIAPTEKNVIVETNATIDPKYLTSEAAAPVVDTPSVTPAVEWYDRGIAAGKVGQYAEAINDFTQAVTINPNYTEAYSMRGLAYYFLQDYRNAIGDSTQAVKINPNFEDAYKVRGDAYLRLQNYRKAIADYTQAIKIDPNYTKAYSMRGLAYYFLQDYRNAIGDYTKIIKINPNFADAYNMRGDAYRQANRMEEAANDAQKACELGNCELLESMRTNGEI